MAVSSDIGDSSSVHSLNKKDVGEQLARWALHDMYKKGASFRPIPVKAVFRGGNVAVYFKYTGKELTTFNQAPLKGFTTDTDPHPDATIHRRKIIIKTNQRPHYVYYGWSPYTDANLMNSEKLPASTFSLEVK